MRVNRWYIPNKYECRLSLLEHSNPDSTFFKIIFKDFEWEKYKTVRAFMYEFHHTITAIYGILLG